LFDVILPNQAITETRLDLEWKDSDVLGPNFLKFIAEKSRQLKADKESNLPIRF